MSGEADYFYPAGEALPPFIGIFLVNVSGALIYFYRVMKNNYITAWRTLFKKGRHNEIKILSLGIGLAMGLVLISKVCFDLSYDNFYPDADRIYRLEENLSMETAKIEGYPAVSGAIAPAMQEEIPEVEAATRIEVMQEDNYFSTDDRRLYEADFIMADSSFFDVLPRPVKVGDPKEILARPLYALVSETIARKIAGSGEVVGRTFQLQSYPGRIITIGGVFEDQPVNSHLDYDVIISMPSFEPLHQFDLTQQWIGGDRFNGYAKLLPGVGPETVEKAMSDMLARHVDMENLNKRGIKLRHTLLPLEEVYSHSPENKRMAIILSFIAFALLFAAVMNYVLVVISSLMARTKEVAVHKCYGASGRNVSDMIFFETALHLIISLGMAALLVLAFRSTIEELVRAPLAEVMTARTWMVLAGVCAGVFVLAGLLPSQLFMRIPVAAAFRSYRESRRNWKRILLFVQFTASGFMVALLSVIGLQYDRMVTNDNGYDPERVVYSLLRGVNKTDRATVMEALRHLGEVEEVSSCFALPLHAGNGNMIYRPSTDEETLHFADLGETDESFVPALGIRILQGKNFSRETADSSQVLVSRLMAEKLADTFDWQDGVLGKSFQVTGHRGSMCTVIGVYDEVRIGVISDEIPEPSILFYSEAPMQTLVVKLRELTAGNREKVKATIREILPDKELSVDAYQTSLTDAYRDSRLFRNAVLIGGIVTLLISLIGLIGYTNDEINRRSKEIAIRKINGATLKDILLLVAVDALYMAIPAVILGVLIARVAGAKWLEKFSDKIPLGAGIFVAGAVVILLLVLTLVVWRTWRVANDNPVDSLRAE